MCGNSNAQLASKPSTTNFDEIYARYQLVVYKYLLGKGLKREDAEDLTNESFLYCHTHLHAYDCKKASLSTWIFIIVNSRLKNYWRDKKHHISLDDKNIVVSDGGTEMERVIQIEAAHNLVSRALKILKEKQRYIIIQRYFYNADISYIAESLGTTENNIRVSMSRALKKMDAYIKMIQ